ncbi:hypothetical protein MTBLM5_450015 [Magnetospirillum sp. LM-5]|nr:hypothetical protein MTBLM5_450015 [Magnetospirillum sp. LM-5]
MLVSRGLLVSMRGDIDNQVRGLQKTFGVLFGKAVGGFRKRAAEIVAGDLIDSPELARLMETLLAAREDICRRILTLDREVMKQAKASEVCRRFMTMPGVGAVVALSIWSAIDDPTRFAKSANVGAYFGPTPRRYASGEIDRSGRISKCGDRDPRTHLYEAANVLLTRISRASALREWGLKIAKRSGFKKAKVAVARKMAGILHRMWIDGTEFRPGTQAAAAYSIGGAPHPTSSSPPGRRPEQGRSLRCCPCTDRRTNADTTLTRSSHPRPCCGGDPDHVENHEPGGDLGERA